MPYINRLKRITDRQLEELVLRINGAYGNAELPYTKIGPGKYQANIGTFYLDYAYGSARLVKIISPGGAVATLIDFLPRRELYEQLGSFLRSLPVR